MKREFSLPRLWSFELRQCSCTLVIALACTLGSSAIAQQVRVTLDPAQTKISIAVHDVHGGFHGTFQMKSGTVAFDPLTGAASGEVLIDANTGTTGNDSRDRKMKKDVLETKRYPEITFTPTHVVGQVATQGESNVKLEGIFHIHGSDHNLVLEMPVQVSGDNVTGTTKFTVPYESWGMKNPSFLFLRVDGTAEVNVEFAGRLALHSAAHSPSQPAVSTH